MVFTLQRYVFRELFRVFLLATIGLTLILSLGGVLAPVQEYGLGPRQVIHILLYFMPIVLTFVLPMAALFASSLTYGRFACDNELDACRASGVSLYTMVYPGLALAILVAIANLLLSFHVMPYFVRLAEKSLKADAKQILFRNIQRRGFYKMPPDGRFLIYADHVDLKRDTLLGIVVVQSDQGVITRIRTADAARIQFDLHEKFNEVRLDVYGARQMGHQAEDLWLTLGQGSFKYPFGSLLGDDIKFKKVNEMKQIRANLLFFDPIARIAVAAYSQLATEALARDLSEKLRSPDGAGYALPGTSRSVRLTAAGCALDDERAIKLLGPIRVEEYDAVSGRHLQSLRCENATVHIDEDTTGPGLSLDLFSLRVEETGQLLVRYHIHGLKMPESLQQDLHRADVLDTVTSDGAAAILRGPPTSMLASLQKQLAREIRRTLVDIEAEMNTRLVFGIGCIPMIMIGIGMGIINRGGHVLSAFGASCVPAAVLVVTILSGKNIMKNAMSEGVSGRTVMWSGLAALMILAAFIYRRLART